MKHYLWMIPPVGGHTILQCYDTFEKAEEDRRRRVLTDGDNEYMVLPVGRYPWQATDGNWESR